MNETTKVIRIVVDASKARAGSDEAVRAMKDLENQVSGLRASMDKVQGGYDNMMRGFARVAAVLAVVAAIKAFATGIAEAGDEVRQTTARLNVLTNAADGSRSAFDLVYKVAKNTGVELKSTGDAFSRLAIAAGEFGATSEQIARVTDVVLKLGRIGGSSSAELASGVQQLGQALASGRLQGDELRSILENMPLVGKAIAKEFGVGLGQLKLLGEEGKLVSDRVFKSLISAGADADAQFKKLPPTLESAGNRAANAWKVFYAAIDDSLGVSRLLADGLDSAADRAEKLAARIRGDINVALADTVSKINDLQQRADRVKASGTARDMPGSDPNIVPPVVMPGAPLPKPRAGYAGQTDVPLSDQAMLRALEQKRLEQSQIASSKADAEMYERDRQYRDAQAKARGAADSRVTDLTTKALTSQEKATRDYNQAVTKLKDDLAQGLIGQTRYNQGMAAASKILAEASGGAKSTAESIKALNEATRDAQFAKKLADAAYQGAGALAEIEAQAKAADKAVDAFGKRNAGFESKYGAQLLEKQRQEYLKDFRSETLETERQNELLAAQVQLIGARPEIAAKELAILRTRLDLEAKGKVISQEDIDRRVQALTLQEKLNRELEDGKKQAEMWAEPFKNAITSVQSTLTDFFEKAFSGSIKSFGDMGSALKSIWFRLMAELASVAVIRPVIEFAVGGLGSLGIVGQQTMQAFGVSGGGSVGGGSGLAGGVGGSGGGLGGLGGGSFNPFGMFGSGGFGGMLGDVGRFMQTPFASLAPSLFGGGGAGSSFSLGGALAGGGSFADVGSLISSGAAGSGLGSGVGGFIGGITPMAGLGALAGVGSGIFSLATGGGSASSIVSGVGSMIGGIVSLIPGVGQILGPIIAIGSTLLGGLLKKDPEYAAQGFATYNAGSKSYTGRVGYETNMKAPIAPGIGNDVLKLLGQYGGGVTPGMSPPEYYLWSGFKDGRMDATVTAEGSPTYKALLEKVWASGQIHNTDEAQWAARTELWTDSTVNGEWTQLPINSLTTDKDKLAQQLFLLIAKAAVRDGSITGLTATSQKIIRNYPEANVEGLGQALTWGKNTYDVLVRPEVMTAAEKTMTDLRDTFKAAIAQAEQYRLATDKLTEAQGRALNKVSTEFGQNITDSILGINDPAALQKLQIEREREQALKEWDYLNTEYLAGNIQTLIDRNKVQELYDAKLNQIVSASLQALDDFERRVRYGDLSAANPLETLAGSLGAYNANTAKALAGDTTAIGQYESFAEAALRQQVAYSGNDYSSDSLRQKILAEIAALQGKSTMTPTAANDELLEATLETNRLMRELLDRMQAT